MGFLRTTQNTSGSQIPCGKIREKNNRTGSLIGTREEEVNPFFRRQKMDKVKRASELIRKAGNIVVLTGAGMSTESGLKDFRSRDGLSSRTYEGYYPEQILSRDFFFAQTDLFYSYIKEKLNVTGISPNKGHLILADWEKHRNLKIITQNIDSLHQKAGSKNVLEIHGTLSTCQCTKCKAVKPLGDILEDGYRCFCGGVYKPDVVLYDEEVSRIMEACTLAEQGDLLLVLGTSLKVYPAASIPEVYGIDHKDAIIINRDETPYAHDFHALEINEGIGDTLEKIDHLLMKTGK